MNRVDRLLAIVLELQAKKHLRGEDLAATFEVSKRTIYRDILALAESGVPIVAIPGQGYSLMEGYFLPPLSFSADEAIMLLLGADLMRQNMDAQYQVAAQSAERKIEAVLSEDLRSEVEYLENSIQFISGAGTIRPDLLATLRRAIIQRRTIHFTYQTRFTRDGGSEMTARDADPYKLIHISGVWYVVAYCHLRHDIRNFRLDRIVGKLDVCDKTFSRPADFRVPARQGEDRTLEIKLLFDRETMPWVREAPSFFQTAVEECPEGLRVTLSIRHEEEIIGWVLSWGAHVHILEPASLRDRVSDELGAMLRNLKNG
jgi:predicted DNA-binding transcriptional regulator YafY